VSNQRIVVIVSGGLVQDVQIPKSLAGVTVEVRDYDNGEDPDDMTGIEQDEHGDFYLPSEWSTLDV
jgi:hypothetical protein